MAIAHTVSDMEVFARVADLGGFSAAARDLGMTQSAVSHLIQRLERRLGAALFERTTRRVSLTTAGDAYLRHCRVVLAEIAAAEQAVMEATSAPRGRLNVSASPAFARAGILPHVPAFLDAYPDIQLDLSLTDTIIDVVGQNVDVAIRVGHLDDSSLIARRLAPTRRIVCAAPAYLARRGNPDTPRNLESHDGLVFRFDEILDRWTFETPAGPTTVKVPARLMSNDAAVLVEAALAGIGIIRAAEFLVGDHVAEGRLVSVLDESNPDDGSAVYAVYAPSRRHSPTVHAFLDFLHMRNGGPRAPD